MTDVSTFFLPQSCLFVLIVIIVYVNYSQFSDTGSLVYIFGDLKVQILRPVHLL